MKKIYILLFIFFLAVPVVVFADDNVAEYCTTDSTAPKDADCFKVYKDQYTLSDVGVYTIKTDLEFTIAIQNGGTRDIKPNFLTTTEDPTMSKSDKWWKTIELCHVYAQYELVTSYYSSTLSGNYTCISYSPKDIDESKLISVCLSLSNMGKDIEDLRTEYKTNSNYKVVSEYRIIKEEIKQICSQATQTTDYKDACLQRCLNINEDIQTWDKYFGIEETKKCGFSGRLISWVINIFKWIKYIIPVVVIVLGILDFIKASSSEKDDDMKKAQGNFVKRLIAAALIFLVPLLIEFILPKFGFDYNSCGIF